MTPLNSGESLNQNYICLMTSHRHDAIGGIETFVESLSKWLRSKKLKTIVVTRKLSVLNPLQVDLHDKSNQPVINPTVKAIRSGSFTYNLYLVFHSLIAALHLMKLVKKYGVMIVHAQDNFAGLSAVLVKKFFNIVVIVHSHGPEFFHHRSFISKAINTSIDKYLTCYVEKILVTDCVSFDYYVSLNALESKIMKLPTAVDSSLFQQNEKATLSDSALNDKKFVIGYIGRLSIEKNISKLLIAFSNLISENQLDSKLILVGDGPEKSRLEEFVLENKLEKSVVFTGWRTDVKQLLDSFDLFVFPSLFEGFPISLLEAMASGKPIITSNIPSIQQIVRDGEEAILINPNNVEELKQALLLVYNNSQLRTQLGQRAKEKVKVYAVDDVYGSLLKVYQSFLN